VNKLVPLGPNSNTPCELEMYNRGHHPANRCVICTSLKFTLLLLQTWDYVPDSIPLLYSKLQKKLYIAY